MPRGARPGFPHHVIQRGNRRQNVFFEPNDYFLYLKLLTIFTKKYFADVWSYCLMPNHVHLILVPKKADDLAKAVGETHKTYTKTINKRHQWKGYLWEGRFKSYFMDNSYVFCAIRYVEMNPVRGRMVDAPEKYPWSSAKSHIENKKSPLLSPFKLKEEISDWRSYLLSAPENETDILRQRVQSNHPLGTPEFISDVEKHFDIKIGTRTLGTCP